MPPVFESWLPTVAAWGTIGVFLDFYIGTVNQKRLRDWMETWWLRISLVQWGNLGREEALFAVHIMDRRFDKCFFSVKRLVVVTSSVLGVIIFLNILIMFNQGKLFPWYFVFQPLSLLWFIMIVFGLSASFSITRFVAVAVARILSRFLFSIFLVSPSFLSFNICY